MAKAKSPRRKRSTRSKGSRGGMMPWYLAATVLVGGIIGYDNREQLRDWLDQSEMTAFLSKSEKAPEKRSKTTVIAPRPKEHAGTRRDKIGIGPTGTGRQADAAAAGATRLRSNGKQHFFLLRHSPR
ncbi:hypothetical protein ABIA16_001997 [Sinorhizobium fredii]